MTEAWEINIENATRRYKTAKDNLNGDDGEMIEFENSRQLLIAAMADAIMKLKQIQITMKETSLLDMKTDGHIH